MRRLPDTELEVMKALWDAGKERVPRATLEARLQNMGWATNTFNTYLARLTEKGVVSCERVGKANYYTPLISREVYLEFESKALLHKLFGSSVTSFVAALARGGALKRSELDELQDYLDQLKGGDVL